MRRMTPTTSIDLIPIEVEPLTIGERFRANVRRLMSEQNVSQAALAERLTDLGEPTKRSTLSVLLISESYPSTRWIELMARAFGVDESEITAAIR